MADVESSQFIALLLDKENCPDRDRVCPVSLSAGTKPYERCRRSMGGESMVPVTTLLAKTLGVVSRVSGHV